MSEVRRIGRYQAIVPIGTGGMATVYLARDHAAAGVNREVALKLVHPHLRESEGAAETLFEEAKLAARIHHRNVVPVREVGEDRGAIYLVMDYIEGATLSKLLRGSGSPPMPIAARILCDALAGLHAAHELTAADGSSLELVHRDFSPQNVLVGVDGVTRLTDFGIAKATSRATVTSTGVVKGKVGYLSPEQALGRPLDRRSDIWAAGIVAWELLAGRRLYDPEAEPVSTIMRIVSETPPRLKSVRPEISAVLDQVVATALALDPNRRWPNAEDMSRALADGFRAQAGIADAEQVGEWVKAQIGDELRVRREHYREHVPPSLRAPPRRPKRSRALVLGLIAIAGVVLGALAIARHRQPPEPVASEPAPIPAAPEISLASAPIAAPEAIDNPPEEAQTNDAGARAPSVSHRSRRSPPSAERMPGIGPNPYRKP